MINKEWAFGHIAAFIAYAIFGFNIIVCKDLTSGGLIPPLGIFTLRSLIAGGLFWLGSREVDIPFLRLSVDSPFA